MTRYRKTSPQGQLEEVQKTLKQSKKPEGPGVNKVNPVIQRAAAESGDTQAILELQQTVGNRAVGRLLTGETASGSPPAVQRESPYGEDEAIGSKVSAGASTMKIPSTPAPPAPVPLPNMGGKLSSGATGKIKTAPGSKMTATKGNEPGTMSGTTSLTAAGKVQMPTNIGPIQSPVAISPGSPTQEEGTSPSPGATANQEPEEESGS